MSEFGEVYRRLLRSGHMPVYVSLFFGLCSVLIYTCLIHGGGVPKHISKAREYYEMGDFHNAISEAEQQLEFDANSQAALVIMADSYYGLATAGRLDSVAVHKLFCKAIELYDRALEIRYDNRIGNKRRVIEERLYGMVDRQGRILGDCETEEKESAYEFTTEYDQ